VARVWLIARKAFLAVAVDRHACCSLTFIAFRLTDGAGPIKRPSLQALATRRAGSLDHMADVLLEGKADAVLAASIFHFGTYTVGDVKRFLAGKGIPVRL